MLPKIAKLKKNMSNLLFNVSLILNPQIWGGKHSLTCMHQPPVRPLDSLSANWMLRSDSGVGAGLPCEVPAASSCHSHPVTPRASGTRGPSCSRSGALPPLQCLASDSSDPVYDGCSDLTLVPRGESRCPTRTTVMWAPPPSWQPVDIPRSARAACQASTVPCSLSIMSSRDPVRFCSYCCCIEEEPGDSERVGALSRNTRVVNPDQDYGPDSDPMAPHTCCSSLMC